MEVALESCFENSCPKILVKLLANTFLEVCFLKQFQTALLKNFTLFHTCFPQIFSLSIFQNILKEHHKVNALKFPVSLSWNSFLVSG